MAVQKSNSEAAVLERSQTALVNAENQPDIAALLAEFGYDTNVIADGKTFLSEAREASDLNQTETNEESQAYMLFAALKNELEKDYALQRKKAKVVFRKDPLTLAMFGMDGEVSRVYVAWLEGIRKYGKAALGDDNLVTQLGRLNLTKELIEATLQKCDRLEVLRAAYLKEKGESQHATITKDKAFRDLDDWMRDFYAVARIALEDSPQLLESLSIVVKN